MEISVACEVTVYLTIDKKRHVLSKAEAEELVTAIQKAIREQTSQVTTITTAAANASVTALTSIGDGRTKYGPWSRTEEARLRAALVQARRPIENIARELNRAVSNCEHRAEAIGLSFDGTRWNDPLEAPHAVRVEKV